MAGDQTAVTKPKTSLGDFIGETRREIGKVIWPPRGEIIQTTIQIVLMAVVAGLFFFVIDWGLGWAVSHLLGMSS